MLSKMFKKAHKKTKEIKAKHQEVDYQAQFGICLSFLYRKMKEEGGKMVKLEGSKKQVKWANDIREEKIEDLKREINVLEGIKKSLVDEDKKDEYGKEIDDIEAAMLEINKIKSAKFFIDNRYENGLGLVKILEDAAKAKEALKAIKNLELAELKGSKKQISWAEKIRNKKLKRLAEIEDWRWNEYYYDYSKEEIIKIIATEITSAKTFIDTRDSIDDLIEEAIQMNK